VSAIPDQATLVAHAIRAADQPQTVDFPDWVRRQLLGQSSCCAYCLTPIDGTPNRPGVIDHLVPVQLGGPLMDANRVLACPTCQRRKGHQDVVSWTAFTRSGAPSSRQAVLDRRQGVLALARNHLTPTRVNAPVVSVERALHSRWVHPRFAVHAVHGADHGWIGWTPRSGSPNTLVSAAALLRFSFHAVHAPAGRVQLYRVPGDRFLDAVWALIEQHALVQPLVVANVDSVPMEPDNWQHHWGTHLEHVADLRRRRAKHTGNNAWTVGTPAHQQMRARRDDAVQGWVAGPDRLGAAPRKPRAF